MYPGKDPYFMHYYRINFDGTGLVTLTPGDGTHAVTFSPDRKVLRRHAIRASIAAPVAELRAGDATAPSSRRSRRRDITRTVRRPAGSRRRCSSPKGRDGKTDIWGVIFRPTNFDPAKKYPVIENIYAGPQGSFVPKAFGAFNRHAGAGRARLHRRADRRHGHEQPLEGVPRRRWKNLGDAGFPDRILWHKAVAAKYP